MASSAAGSSRDGGRKGRAASSRASAGTVEASKGTASPAIARVHGARPGSGHSNGSDAPATIRCRRRKGTSGEGWNRRQLDAASLNRASRRRHDGPWCHAGMAQQGVDAGSAATEGEEVLRGRTAAAAGQDLAQEAPAYLALLSRRFLECCINVGAEHLGPLVA